MAETAPRQILHPLLELLLAGQKGGYPPVDGGIGASLPQLHDADDHPRVRFATQLRRNVRAFGDERGLVTLATGLAGRSELSIEADPAGHGRGWGRSLLRDALGLVPPGEPVFAAISPGNARSLRAFLAVGFRPIGSEVIIRPRRQ